MTDQSIVLRDGKPAIDVKDRYTFHSEPAQSSAKPAPRYSAWRRCWMT
jgi:hypothetical protein